MNTAMMNKVFAHSGENCGGSLDGSNDCPGCFILELIRSVRAIAHGDVHGPTGLEMVAMAIGGEGVSSHLGPAVSDMGMQIAESIREGMEYVGDANERGFKAIADAIREGAGG